MGTADVPRLGRKSAPGGKDACAQRFVQRTLWNVMKTATDGVAICSIKRSGAYLSVQSSADQVAYRHDERDTYPPHVRSLSLTFLLAVKAHPDIASVACIAVGSRSKLRGATLQRCLRIHLQPIAEITAISGRNTTTEQLGFGFVGAGEIAVASAAAVCGGRHAWIARTYDVHAPLAQDLATRFGGQPADSLETLLADPHVTAVYICVPHHLHRAAAVAGKHVFVEKPMGINPDDAQAIVDACRQHGVACGVPFVARYAPAYREAHRLIHAGAIGEVTGFRLTYRGDKPDSYWNGGYSQRASSDWRQRWATAGGSVLIMNTIHDLDAILWITGLDVAQVQGVIAHTSSPGEVEDYALAILSCSGGVLGSLEAVSALPGGQGPARGSVNRIYGRHGQIVLRSPWSSDPLALFTRETGQWHEIASVPVVDARQLAFDDFAAAVLHTSPIPIPGEAGLNVSRVLHAVYDAARRGEYVAVAAQSAPAARQGTSWPSV
jgi:predicted dehydrogenase